jgi:DNA-binding NarL/FixJ family response regulator
MGWKQDRARQHSLYPGQREALTRWRPAAGRREAGAVLREIAEAMDVSPRTVASYLGGAVVALGTTDFASAREAAESQGLVPFHRGV